MEFSHSAFSASDPRNSGAFKKLGKEVTKNLSLSQQKALYEKFKEHEGSFDVVRETFKDLKKDKTDGVTTYAVGRMEQALRNKNNINSQKKSISHASSNYSIKNRQSIIPTQRPTSGVQLNANLVRKNSGLMNSGLVVKR